MISGQFTRKYDAFALVIKSQREKREKEKERDPLMRVTNFAAIHRFSSPLRVCVFARASYERSGT